MAIQNIGGTDTLNFHRMEYQVAKKGTMEL